MRILLPMQVTLAVPSALAANAVQQGVSGGGQFFKQVTVANFFLHAFVQQILCLLDAPGRELTLGFSAN